MRAVVTDGTAKQLQGDGTVYAKTGTAEFTDAKGDIHAHAWTVGYRGDLAFVAMIVGGDDSKRTNAIIDAFLKALPAGAYLPGSGARVRCDRRSTDGRGDRRYRAGRPDAS